jgi:hypothetical protein
MKGENRSSLPPRQLILGGEKIKRFAYEEVCDRCENPELCTGSCRKFENFILGGTLPSPQNNESDSCCNIEEQVVSFVCQTEYMELFQLYDCLNNGIISWYT